MLTITDFINILHCYYKSPLVSMNTLQFSFVFVELLSAHLYSIDFKDYHLAPHVFIRSQRWQLSNVI